MRRTALVLLALAVLAGTAMAQELTFGKYGIGLGFGSQYFFLNTTTPSFYMNSTRTVRVGNSAWITNGYVIVNSLPFEQAIATAIPFDVTWRPIEALGVRAGASYLMGKVSHKESMTINETTVDTNGIIETTIRTTGTGNTEITDNISGFPFAFSLVPSFKIGDKVLLQPEGGVVYYNVSVKGDKGSYTQNVTDTQVDRDINNNTSTTTTSTTSDVASGKMPDLKYSGLGTFWGFEAQVLVHKNVAVRAGLRKGGATLKEKVTVPDTRFYQGGGGIWYRYNDQTTYETSLHVGTEAYTLGLVYNF